MVAADALRSQKYLGPRASRPRAGAGKTPAVPGAHVLRANPSFLMAGKVVTSPLGK